MKGRCSYFRIHARVAFLAGGLLLLSGCTIVTDEVGEPIEPGSAGMEEGVSTREVLDTLGPPAMVSALGEGYAFLYEYALVREKQVGLSVNYLWLRYLKFSIGSAEADREALVMTFDGEGRLLASGYRAWTEDLGKGTSVQLLISVMSVVDTEELTETPLMVKWGGELLQSRLQQSLNRQNSMMSGTSGLEQTATPSGSGQRTLESDTFPIPNLNSY